MGLQEELEEEATPRIGKLGMDWITVSLPQLAGCLSVWQLILLFPRTAPLPHRAKHFAQLSSAGASTSSASSSSSTLSFPNRSYRRLLVTLQTAHSDGTVETVCSDIRTGLTPGDEGDDYSVKQEMNEAMWEAADEEVFNEVCSLFPFEGKIRADAILFFVHS